MYLLAAIALALGSATPAHGVRPDHAVEYEYLYDLASFDGELEAAFARVTFDPTANEVFVLHRRVYIFNDRGMQLFDFGGDAQLGYMNDVAVLPDGRMYVLTRQRKQDAIVECNFRGEPKRRVELTGVPDELAARFAPQEIEVRGDHLYFADLRGFAVVVTDTDGAFERAFDLLELIDLDGESAEDHHLEGFAVGPDGSVFITVPTMFSAYEISPAGEVRQFGERGSKPGQFNVAGAIAVDEDGGIYITDVLRAVVMVFDREHRFRGEFGYRGRWPGRLITPRDIAVGNGDVYVAQGAGRGVSVFRVSSPTPISEIGVVPASRPSPVTASDSPAVPLVSQNKESNR